MWRGGPGLGIKLSVSTEYYFACFLIVVVLCCFLCISLGNIMNLQERCKNDTRSIPLPFTYICHLLPFSNIRCLLNH